MENITQRWTQSGHFLQNQGTFFSIFKIGQGRPPPPPTLVACLIEEKNLFRPNGISTIPLSFLYLIVLKILTFSYTLLSAGRPSRKTSATRTYHDEEKIPRKKFHLQDTTKTSIKTMETSSLLNTDLGN